MSSVKDYHDLLSLGLKEPVEEKLPSASNWDWEIETDLPPLKPWLLIVLIPALCLLCPLIIVLLITGASAQELEIDRGRSNLYP